MTASDCFRILGIPRNACLSDLKFAYRNKAKQYHPDKNGGDGRLFNSLHEAYSFLLDNGILKPGFQNPGADVFRGNTDVRSPGEAYRKAAEVRLRREAARQAEREKATRKAAEKAAFEKTKRDFEKRAAERRAAYEDKIKMDQMKKAKEQARKISKENSPSHKVFLAGEILKGSYSDRQKMQAIDSLVALKRKSAYPFLKIALYENSHPIVLASIAAIGKLKIIQAGPELSSLMCSGSIKIRKEVLETIGVIGNKSLYRAIINMALRDRDKQVRCKAEDIFKRIYE